MKVVFLWTIVPALCGAICIAASIGTGEKCEWKYECCAWDRQSGLCHEPCPNPTINCPDDPGPGRDPNKLSTIKVIVSVPCNEGYRLDRTNRCRKIFDDQAFF